MKQKKCIHKGNPNIWHPQFCYICGKEFIYEHIPLKQLDEEITNKIIILHGVPDIVQIPLYLWNEIIKKIR